MNPIPNKANIRIESQVHHHSLARTANFVSSDNLRIRKFSDDTSSCLPADASASAQACSHKQSFGRKDRCISKCANAAVAQEVQPRKDEASNTTTGEEDSSSSSDTNINFVLRGDQAAFTSSHYYKCEDPHEQLLSNNKKDTSATATACAGFTRINATAHPAAKRTTLGDTKATQDRLRVVASTLHEATMVAMLVDQTLAEKRSMHDTTIDPSLRLTAEDEEAAPRKRRRYQRRNSVVIHPKQLGAALGGAFSMLPTFPQYIERTEHHACAGSSKVSTKVARAG